MKTHKNKLKTIKTGSKVSQALVKYVPGMVGSTSILTGSLGEIKVMSFDKGEGMPEETSSNDKFAQLIEGKAEVLIDGDSNFMHKGEGIILPAHLAHSIEPNGQFKIILTEIKDVPDHVGSPGLK